MKKRVHVYYDGMVQGVGFRFTVEHLARQVNGVTGWVRNTPDGKVELLCEGEEDVLKDFLKRIRDGAMKGYIQNVAASYSEATGEFKGFDIRFIR